MNIIKIDTTALLKNYSNYTLNNNDKNRVKDYLELIRKHEIHFKYFITIAPYKFIPNNDFGRTTIINFDENLKRKNVFLN